MILPDQVTEDRIWLILEQKDSPHEPPFFDNGLNLLGEKTVKSFKNSTTLEPN